MDKRKTVGEFFLKSRAIIKRCSEEASAKADGSHRDGECFSEHVMAYYAEKHLYSARLRPPACALRLGRRFAVPMWLCGAARALNAARGRGSLASQTTVRGDGW